MMELAINSARSRVELSRFAHEIIEDSRIGLFNLRWDLNFLRDVSLRISRAFDKIAKEIRYFH